MNMNVDSIHFIKDQGKAYQVKIVARPPRKVTYIRRLNGRGAWTRERFTVLIKQFREMVK